MLNELNESRVITQRSWYIYSKDSISVYSNAERIAFRGTHVSCMGSRYKAL